MLFKMLRMFCLVLSIAVLLAACGLKSKPPTYDSDAAALEAAKQAEMAARLDVERLRRVDDVYYPVRSAGAPICGEHVRPVIGWLAMTLHEAPKGLSGAYAKVLNLDDSPRLVSVARGSAADAAGLREGDIIEQINGTPIPKGKKAVEAMNKLLDEALERGGAITVTAWRPPDTLHVALTPVSCCQYPVHYMRNDEVNAYADGEGIIVNSGMLRFVEDDDELALILGHELAHNSMEHLKTRRANQVIGAVFDALLMGLTGVYTTLGQQTGIGALSLEMETEADYVGLYFAARGGFAYERTPDLWRRMAMEHPAAISRGSTHPPTSERFVALEAAVEEVRAKVESGAEVLPEMK